MLYKRGMDLIVTADGPGGARGTAASGDRRWRCALGRAGIRVDKREGDGATPAGRFRLLEVFYRPDRIAAPRTALPVTPIAETDGWCDDPGEPDYNRKVMLPHPGSCERLWRDDALYDIVVVTDHNTAPVVAGAGSGIFVHVAGGPDYPPTRGCIAFAREDLLALLESWSENDRLEIGAG